MKGMLRILVLLLLWVTSTNVTVIADDRWSSSIDTPDATVGDVDSVLTIDKVLALVAAHNPTLRALEFVREASRSRLKQAGLWRNPELSTEFEEVGWDAPGLSESEITVAVSQEFEIFGQRSARKKVALADIEATTFETKLEAFDLYLEVKKRFFKLFYTQNRVALADTSVMLAENIASSIENRMKQGIALQSEYLLAQLELQRVNLEYQKVQQELSSSIIRLAALWRGSERSIKVIASKEPDLRGVIDKIPAILNRVDSTRHVQQMQYSIEKVRSEKLLASKEAKPNITMSGGFKRLEFNNSNSFLFGVSLPLPFFNKNQGEIASHEATIRSSQYRQEQLRADTKGFINSAASQLEQLMNQHMTLDTLLLPTAENAYNTIKETYSVGRIPYTSLLEAERSLIELRFEHNDILLAIQEQLIAIEQISGIRMYE